MGETTAISWTDHTFNSWWGCVKVSPACTSCYAERDAKRYGHDIWGPTARRRFFGDKHWREPLKWNAAAVRDGVVRRVFCSSMADVFEQLPDGHPDVDQMRRDRERLFRDLIPSTPRLDWLILTKRPDVMARYFAAENAPRLTNVVAMTTAENQEWFDKRIAWLLETPATRRGLSLEPLLGPIDLWPWASLQSCRACWRTQPEQDVAACVYCGSPKLHQALSWVITGGESGPKARPTHPDWVRSLRDQCGSWEPPIPFHHKQWGEWTPGENVNLQRGIVPTAHWFNGGWDFGRDDLGGSEGHVDDEPTLYRVGKKAAGRLLDGRTWDEFPEVHS